MEYEKLSNKAMSVLYITAILQTVCVAGFFSAAFLLLASYQLTFAAALRDFAWVRIAVPCVFAGLGALWAVFVPLVRFRRYRYKIAEDRVEIVEGILFIRRTIVPIDRIHQLDIIRGPLDSRFGVAKVTLTTAGSTATFRFLELTRAEAIAETLNAAIAQKLRRGMQPDGGSLDNVH